jgi:hypothetical protein
MIEGTLHGIGSVPSSFTGLGTPRGTLTLCVLGIRRGSKRSAQQPSDPKARHVQTHGFERFDRRIPFVPVDAELEPSTGLEPIGCYGSRLEIDEPMVPYTHTGVVGLLHQQVMTPRAFRQDFANPIRSDLPLHMRGQRLEISAGWNASCGIVHTWTLHPSSLGWMEQENDRQTDLGIGQ